MNIVENLIHKKLDGGGFVLLPYLYYRKPKPIDSDTALIGVVFLQYDAPGVDGHKSVSVENYMDAPTVETGLPKNVPMMYLVKSKKENEEDIRIESKFGDGILWGWFPKHLQDGYSPMMERAA